MQKGLFAWLFYTAISFHCIYLSGQSFPAPAVEVFVEFKGDSVAFDPLDSLATYVGDSIAVTLLVMVPGVPAPTKIHVKVGSAVGSADLADSYFTVMFQISAYFVF